MPDLTRPLSEWGTWSRVGTAGRVDTGTGSLPGGVCEGPHTHCRPAAGLFPWGWLGQVWKVGRRGVQPSGCPLGPCWGRLEPHSPEQVGRGRGASCLGPPPALPGSSWWVRQGRYEQGCYRARAVSDLEAKVAEGPPEPAATEPGLFKSRRARGNVRQRDLSLSPSAPPRGP